MSLFFIRHGESESNERNLFAGRFDTPLTNLGRRQAQKARRIIKDGDFKIDEIHVSPLSRALDTAKIVRGDDNISLVVTQDLIERDFGQLSEQNKSLIKKYFGADQFEYMFHSAQGKPPRGESFDEMYVRVKNYHENVLLPLSLQGKNILVVAHKYIIEMFALIAAEKTPEQYHDFRIPNSKPCDWSELRERALTASRSANQFAEEIEARLPSFILMAAFVGLLLKVMIGASLPSWLFTAMTIGLLAVNSGISLLRLEPDTLKTAPSSFAKVWKGSLLRAGLGLFLMLVPDKAIAKIVGSFLLLPPAMTAPTFSLMWGGDYFLCVQSTLLMSLVSPLVLGLAVYLGGPQLFGGQTHLSLFYLMLLLSVVLPGVFAQVFRAKEPIKAGAITTNWGWLGGAAVIPLAALSSFQFMPEHLNFQLGDILLPIFLFVLVRGIGHLAARLTRGNQRLKLDVYINHIVPNVFFWFALLPDLGNFAQVRLFTLLIFFVSIYLEEKIFVLRFPYSAGLKRPLQIPERLKARA